MEGVLVRRNLSLQAYARKARDPRLTEAAKSKLRRRANGAKWEVQQTAAQLEAARRKQAMRQQSSAPQLAAEAGGVADRSRAFEEPPPYPYRATSPLRDI